jgi:hypothetical protein
VVVLLVDLQPWSLREYRRERTRLCQDQNAALAPEKRGGMLCQLGNQELRGDLVQGKKQFPFQMDSRGRRQNQQVATGFLMEVPSQVLEL